MFQTSNSVQHFVHHSLHLSLSLIHVEFIFRKMSKNSMAPISYSSSSASSSHDNERLDLESIRALVVSVNKHILEFLVNPESRNSLKLRCTSKLKCQNQEFFEFSEHSVLSNLYWGIECIESAIKAECPEERTDRLRSCEQMLQVPALLDEHGVTAGIQNQYLVCCSYFYLSVVRKLQRDELQVALHFLQALLVCPRIVMTEIAPTLCESLFHLCTNSERQNSRGRRTLGLVSFEEEVGEVMRQMARRCKDRLMYHQVMLYGQTPQWLGECSDIPVPAGDTQYPM